MGVQFWVERRSPISKKRYILGFVARRLKKLTHNLYAIFLSCFVPCRMNACSYFEMGSIFRHAPQMHCRAQSFGTSCTRNEIHLCETRFRKHLLNTSFEGLWGIEWAFQTWGLLFISPSEGSPGQQIARRRTFLKYPWLFWRGSVLVETSLWVVQSED